MALKEVISFILQPRSIAHIHQDYIELACTKRYLEFINRLIPHGEFEGRFDNTKGFKILLRCENVYQGKGQLTQNKR